MYFGLSSEPTREIKNNMQHEEGKYFTVILFVELLNKHSSL